MAKTRKNQKVPTEAEQIARDLKRARERFIPEPPPHRIWKVGDEVVVGNIKKSVVEEVFDGGKFYTLRQITTDNNYGNPIESERVMLCEWLSCYPKNVSNEVVGEESDIFISFSQRDLSSLLYAHYSFGVDDTMEYQRELVWNMEDKICLIDSIYKNIDIGKFCLIKLPFKPDSPSYEILDGKQRLNALKEFYESRFKYKGLFFHEMSRKDRHIFTNFHISWGETKNMTEEQKYRYFLRLNTQGKPQDQKHMQKVMNLWKESQKL